MPRGSRISLLMDSAAEDAPPRGGPRAETASGAADAPTGRGPRPGLPGAAPRIDEHLVSILSPDSFEADQYRVLRHFLEWDAAGKKLRVIAVSSPAAGEGKTTTAVNLAATLAQSPGARVLLVDLDLRRPCVASSLGLPPGTGPGMAGAVLDAGLDLSSVVRRTPGNLAVAPAGAPTGNAYQILESPRVGRLLEEARGAYDYVVVDTPPLLLVPDCRLLSQWVDGFMIVVAARRTPRRLLAEALAAMEPARLVGIVFNGDERPLSGYDKEYYAAYYRPRAQGPGGRGWLSRWRRARGGERRAWR